MVSHGFHTRKYFKLCLEMYCYDWHFFLLKFQDYRVGIIGIYLFVIGCCVGSFINVVHFRMPLGKSIIFPGSRCTKCNFNLKWFDNIPLISWILLGAKCRSCKQKISITYPLIELTTGLIFCANFFAYPSIFNQLPKSLIIFLGTLFRLQIFLAS